jgi:hypothetical protein
MKQITEHLVFVAMMVPTLLVLAAAAVSLGQPDPTVLTTQLSYSVAAHHEAESEPF